MRAGFLVVFSLLVFTLMGCSGSKDTPAVRTAPGGSVRGDAPPDLLLDLTDQELKRRHDIEMALGQSYPRWRSLYDGLLVELTTTAPELAEEKRQPLQAVLAEVREFRTRWGAEFNRLGNASDESAFAPVAEAARELDTQIEALKTKAATLLERPVVRAVPMNPDGPRTLENTRFELAGQLFSLASQPETLRAHLKGLEGLAPHLREGEFREWGEARIALAAFDRAYDDLRFRLYAAKTFAALSAISVELQPLASTPLQTVGYTLRFTQIKQEIEAQLKVTAPPMP